MHAFRFATRRFFVGASGGGAFLAAAAAATIPSSSAPSQADSESSTIRVPYLLVGGGTAAYHAACTIRAREPEARVLIVGEEMHTPYNRTQLSKELWWYGDRRTPESLTYVSTVTGRRRDICYEADGFYPSPEQLTASEADGGLPHGAVALIRGTRVSRVNAAEKIAELSDGRRVQFEKCLIATGSSGKPHPKLDFNDFGGAVSELRNIDDFRHLVGIFEGEKQPKRVAILGGGNLASELAYSLNRRYGKGHSPLVNAVVSGEEAEKRGRTEIYQITPTPGILARILPPTLSEHATEKTRASGINVITNCTIESAEKGENGAGVRLVLNEKSSDGSLTRKTLEFDHVIVDNGVRPNVDVAQRSKLPLDEELGGLKADSEMKVTDSIWAAGDVCSFEDKTLRRRRRLVHWENAQTTGRVAGENMTGGQKSYAHQAAFEAIFGEMDRVHAVGEVDAQRLRTITYILRPSVEDVDYHSAVVFYVDEADTENRVLGVALLNVFNVFAIDVARKLIDDALPHSDAEFDDLIKLFDLFNERQRNDEDDDDEGEDQEVGARDKRD